MLRNEMQTMKVLIYILLIIKFQDHFLNEIRVDLYLENLNSDLVMRLFDLYYLLLEIKDIIYIYIEI